MKHKINIRLTPDVNQIPKKYVLKPSCCDCRFLNQYEPNEYYCMLFERYTEKYYLGGAHRLICCQLASKFQNGIQYIPYEFETAQFDKDSCGQCGLQYLRSLEGNYRLCLGFNQPIEFEQGLNRYGDDVYEKHYRCNGCLKSQWFENMKSSISNVSKRIQQLDNNISTGCYIKMEEQNDQ